MYKKCALIIDLQDHSEELQSVYSGEVYIIGKTYIEKVKENHQGGYYAYDTIIEALDAIFPDDSQNTEAEKIIVKVEMWGKSIEYGNGKKAFTYMKLIETISKI